MFLLQKWNALEKQYLEFDDPHGLHLEIVEREEGEPNTWNFGGVTSEVAIKGFGGATLLSTQPKQTAELLEKVMGLEVSRRRRRFYSFPFFS